MQLKLTRKSDYSVRAMIYIARRHGDGPCPARHIASEMAIPYKYLTQLLPPLVSEELLAVKHGPAGGYALARPPPEISLLDVMEITEGEASVDQCALTDGPCDWEDTCPIHDTWAQAQAVLAQVLGGTSLAELAEIDAAIEAGEHVPSALPHVIATTRHGERNPVP